MKRSARCHERPTTEVFEREMTLEICCLTELHLCGGRLVGQHAAARARVRPVARRSMTSRPASVGPAEVIGESHSSDVRGASRVGKIVVAMHQVWVLCAPVIMPPESLAFFAPNMLGRTRGDLELFVHV